MSGDSISKKRLKKGDVLLIVIFVIALLGLGLRYMNRSQEPVANAYVQIENFIEKTVEVYRLYEGQDEVLEIEGPIGLTTVLLQDGAATVSSSDCADQICVHVFGWLRQPGQISVCLPNEVMVRIVAVDEIE